ncbi:MAG: LAGLIDADG family homing endonuclease [archaeon]
MAKEKFGVEIKENTISGWIFRGIVPFANEKTQFKAKPKPKKGELYALYVGGKQSAEKLGKKYGVSTIVVINWLKSYNIQTRTHMQSMNTPNIKKELRERKLRKPTKNFSRMSPAKAYILGVLCGDGHINPKFVRFEIRNDEEFMQEFLKCLENVYGLKYRFRYYKPRNSLVATVSSQIICSDLLRYSNFGVKNWKVPDKIMESSVEEIISPYVRGVFDSEGCVGKSTISISSICEGGLNQIKLLLRKLGIESKVRPVNDGRYYVLYIFRKQRFKIFRGKVGFTIKRKQEKLDEVLKNDRFYKEA